MRDRDAEIPHEIPRRERLQQATRARIPPYPSRPVHVPALVVEDDHVQRERADDDALEQRHDVHVPVDCCAFVEVGVGCRTEERGEAGGDPDVDDGVEGYCEEDLVDVEGESWEGEVRGQRLGRAL